MEFQKTKLSVNVNKIATLRNARGKNTPDIIYLTKLILESKAHGITVHPRPDERHIRYEDVYNIKDLLENYPNKEYNIEGYPNKKFLSLIKKIKPHQCTLVPDPPDALTSNQGWDFIKNISLLKKIIQELQSLSIRVSLFLDPFTMNKQQWLTLKELNPDRIELYTESYANSWNSLTEEKTLSIYKEATQQATLLNLQINAGHDLNLDNLLNFLRAIPEVKEISVGQALIADALEYGLKQVIQKYLDVINKSP